MQFANLFPVPFNQVHLSDGFWAQRKHTVRKNTAVVCLDQCDRTGRVSNFLRAAKLEEGGFEGIYFNDSDVYKVLEGVAYVLMEGGDDALARRADQVIDAICAAQLDDGYLYTYYTLTGLEKRWTDMAYHEAYCLGHMIEGAIAYAQATGKDKWLRTAIRAVEQMMDVFGPGKRHWVTGHQEIELALVRLYRYTGDARFLEFAEFLVDERGHGHLVSEEFDRIGFNEAYCQDDLPARELSRVTGHAVRAMYYYSAMADIASIRQDEKLAEALEKLWANVSPGNLYITGGIGQSSDNEGFTEDFSLPNLTAYCETCASIGMALWNQRMNLMTGDAKYADLVEREMYNGILAGISLDGKKFFYDNPLSSVGKYNRSEWFGCSCCPTNLVRFIPSVAGYAYATSGKRLYVNQFIPGEATIAVEGGTIEMSVETAYPYGEQVSIFVRKAPNGATLCIRRPGWCAGYQCSVNGQAKDADVLDKGYLLTPVHDGDRVEITVAMPVRLTHCDERVKENIGRVAVEKGPFVFCAEEIDNPGRVREYFHAFKELHTGATIQAHHDDDMLGGVDVVDIGDTRLIPYYVWNNRGKGAMAVWLREKR